MKTQDVKKNTGYPVIATATCSIIRHVPRHNTAKALQRLKWRKSDRKMLGDMQSIMSISRAQIG